MSGGSGEDKSSQQLKGRPNQMQDCLKEDKKGKHLATTAESGDVKNIHLVRAHNRTAVKGEMK